MAALRRCRADRTLFLDASPAVLRARKEDRRSGEAMRRCPVCGTYFPEKTGVWRKDVCYCSEECRRRGERS